MTLNGWIQILVYCGIIILLVKPVGGYMTRVFNGDRTLLSPLLVPVLQKRMQWATKLLTNAAFLPVKEVAIMTGFDDANYFSKVFRRVFGASPTEFRTTGMDASVSNRKIGSDGP